MFSKMSPRWMWLSIKLISGRTGLTLNFHMPFPQWLIGNNSGHTSSSENTRIIHEHWWYHLINVLILFQCITWVGCEIYDSLHIWWVLFTEFQKDWKISVINLWARKIAQTEHTKFAKKSTMIKTVQNVIKMWKKSKNAFKTKTISTAVKN